MKTALPAKALHRAVRERDASLDRAFIIAVRTTGIFCRPSCPARRPAPQNVCFFPSPAEALRAGFRPCKRCKPLETRDTTPDWFAKLSATLEKSPQQRLTDADLRDLNVEPSAARRYFKRKFGMTFQAYQRKRRMSTALAEIRSGEDALTVALRCGFQSSSGFRSAFSKLFGGPPGRSSTTDCIRLRWIETPVGPLLAGAQAQGVCLLEFVDRRGLAGQLNKLRKRFKTAMTPGEQGHLEQLQAELAEYFAETRQEFDVPLILRGSAFQERVWRRLRGIPYGETISYDRLARDIGHPLARRAVGRANGDNPLAILVPCHRVIRSDGGLGGYGGGLWRKRVLIDLEKRAAARQIC